MRNLATCFFAIALFAPSVYGATPSRVLPTTKITDESAETRTDVSDSAVTRTRTATAPQKNIITRSVMPTRISDNATPVSDAVQIASTITRSATGTAQARANLNTAVHTVGRNTRVSDASINNNPTLRRAGVVLRPSTAEVGGRAKIAGTDIQTRSNMDQEIREISSRAANVIVPRLFEKKESETELPPETMAQTRERMDIRAELNSSCQERYNTCMDQFCNVLDDQMGRCTCSSNYSEYSRVSRAATDATSELNDVANRMRYVGMSADEIKNIYGETIAEEEMSSSHDDSEIKKMLEKIQDKIVEPSTTSGVYAEENSNLLDLDIFASSNLIDLSGILGGNSSDSISNLRGVSLYNVARRRCENILTQCEEAGATISQITANYDMHVDSACETYADKLRQQNDTVLANVRSANQVLQQARMAVYQNKNQYDVAGCVAELDKCMQDIGVCGEKYDQCLDPTNRYIASDGTVVLGQNITYITDFMASFDASTVSQTSLQTAHKLKVDDTNCSATSTRPGSGNDGACIVHRLLDKIGTEKNTGMCRDVLDKCRQFTYDTRGKYEPYNQVIVSYIKHALTKIRQRQFDIIAEYASTCLSDVNECYETQMSAISASSASGTKDQVLKVLRGACRNTALTCAYAVFDGIAMPDPNTGERTTGCPAAVSATAGSVAQRNAYLECLSDVYWNEMFNE
ncbi:MAG: hypothetical protein J6S06_01820 [Alphaproteobacteria bacterium]|nr:hypothetical protein [Alphaproteobacteria bacterium]